MPTTSWTRRTSPSSGLIACPLQSNMLKLLGVAPVGCCITSGHFAVGAFGRRWGRPANRGVANRRVQRTAPFYRRRVACYPSHRRISRARGHGRSGRTTSSRWASRRRAATSRRLRRRGRRRLGRRAHGLAARRGVAAAPPAPSPPDMVRRANLAWFMPAALVAGHAGRRPRRHDGRRGVPGRPVEAAAIALVRRRRDGRARHRPGTRDPVANRVAEDLARGRDGGARLGAVGARAKRAHVRSTGLRARDGLRRGPACAASTLRFAAARWWRWPRRSARSSRFPSAIYRPPTSG